jgi:Gpi18-like mannosyltransferase
MLVSIKLLRARWLNGVAFVLASWLFSRLLIVATMVATSAIAATSGKHLPFSVMLTQWDGVWYERIATTGYTYHADGQPYPVAFFPLFPLLSRAVMALGLPFAAAGSLVSALAFLGTLTVVYFWIQNQYSVGAARWSVLILTWCPLSLYSSVTYTEALFLLLSTLSLRAFDQEQYRWAAFWGALTTATRLNGVTLVPTFLFLAWRKRRPAIAYLAAMVTGIGLLAYMAYCAVQFGNPLAFLHVQYTFGQRSSPGFDWFGWGRSFWIGLVGPWNQSTGLPKNPSHLFQVGLIATASYFLWRWRARFPSVVIPGLGFLLLVWTWLLWGDGLIKTLMVGGGIYLLWYWRHALRPVLLVYGSFSLLLILFSGSIIATDRYTYAIVAIAIAAGMMLHRYPRWGMVMMLFFAIVLASFTARFAQGFWVA